jgi:hypothetical protein
MYPAPVARAAIPWTGGTVSLLAVVLSLVMRHGFYLVLKVAVLYFATGFSG